MGNWEANWERDVLERIVILLFALAGLADRAGGAPFLRRRQVLGILSHGEVVARAFLIGMVSDAQVPTDALEKTRDAAHLAVSLRALALMLCVLLAQAPSPPRVAVGRRVDPKRPVVDAGRHAAAPIFDTS
jgi:hypothetical protein